MLCGALPRLSVRIVRTHLTLTPMRMIGYVLYNMPWRSCVVFPAERGDGTEHILARVVQEGRGHYERAGRLHQIRQSRLIERPTLHCNQARHSIAASVVHQFAFCDYAACPHICTAARPVQNVVPWRISPPTLRRVTAPRFVADI